jgi:hypothetical protein
MINKITHCRICGNTELAPILNLGTQSLTGVFPKLKNEKLTSGPLELIKCLETDNKDSCGLVQLGHSYDKNEMYGDNYGYRSSLNNSMVSHLKDLVNKILKIVSLRNDDIVIDIGSNDGTLLGMFPGEIKTLIGIDPTINKFSKYYDKRITQIADFFSVSTVKRHIGNKRAKVISSIAMFYDLEDPLNFARQVYEIIDEDGIWVLEQSYLLFMLKQNAYDTICHEHLEYFALKQLKWILDKAGFKIIDIEYNDTNGGSIKLSAAKKTSLFKECSEHIAQALRNETDISLNTLKPFDVFRNNVELHKKSLVTLIRNFNKQGKRIFGYGASTKGNVILQYCQLTSKDIPYIAEVNEDKFGLFTPQTFIPIIPEEQAKSMNPDYFLVFPWHFKSNLLEKEDNYIKRGCKFIFPLPEIEIVG